MAQHSSDAGAISTAGLRARRRVLQFLAALRFRQDPEVDRRLRAIVYSDALWLLLQRLSPYDRVHHLRVHDDLAAAGYDDPDLLLAAALHDIGKAGNRGRVRLGHRVVYVILARIAPAALRRATANSGNALTHGLYLAQHHPELGAALAAGAGASEYCCRLIAGHQSNPETVADPLLLALIRTDEGRLA